MWGIEPSAMYLSMSFQSAASQPMRRTRLASREEVVICRIEYEKKEEQKEERPR